MLNKKISQLTSNTSPTSDDLLVMVNSGVTKNISLSGLTDYFQDNIIFSDKTITGGTFINGVLTLVDNFGDSVMVSGFTSNNTFITGGTYFETDGVITFINNTGGTFNVGSWSYITGGTYSDGTLSLSGTGILNGGTQITGFTNNNLSTELVGNLWDGSNKYITTLTDNLTLTLNSTKVAGLLVIKNNNSYILTINSTIIPINDSTATVIGFTKANGDYYIIDKNGLTIEIDGPDFTPPIVISASAVDSNTIRIVFDDTMSIVTVAGYSFKQNGNTITPDSVSGNDDTWDFVVSETLISSDTILRSYDSTIGNTIDFSGNSLISYTDQSVTNNINTPYTYVVWDILSNGSTYDSINNKIDSNNGSNAGGYQSTGVTIGPNFELVHEILSDTAVLAIDSDVDGTFSWISPQNFIGGIYKYQGQIYAATTNLGVADNVANVTSPAMYGKIKRVGNDLVYQYSVDEITWNTLYTQTNGFLGITIGYIKCIFAISFTLSLRAKYRN